MDQMNKDFSSDFSPSFNSPVQKPSKILQSAGIYHQSLFLYHILFTFIETTGSTLTLLGWVLIVIYWTIPVIQCFLSTQILHYLQFIKVALYMLPYEYFYEVISPKIVAIIEKKIGLRVYQESTIQSWTFILNFNCSNSMSQILSYWFQK